MRYLITPPSLLTRMRGLFCMMTSRHHDLAMRDTIWLLTHSQNVISWSIYVWIESFTPPFSLLSLLIFSIPRRFESFLPFLPPFISSICKATSQWMSSTSPLARQFCVWFSREGFSPLLNNIAWNNMLENRKW